MLPSATGKFTKMLGEDYHVGVLVRRIFLHERMPVAQAFKLAAFDRFLAEAAISFR